ncbi:unnamed protein product [Ranitomeya imitator]|uniref:Uncharacterized protein n=1 Tax=Ranitomeya imitator TaxID=111125 RepID=A0ABN9KT28_9NEOB|nr:unnamed protein product [Ranitomeya imitator]
MRQQRRTLLQLLLRPPMKRQSQPKKRLLLPAAQRRRKKRLPQHRLSPRKLNLKSLHQKSPQRRSHLKSFCYHHSNGLGRVYSSHRPYSFFASVLMFRVLCIFY